MSAASIRIRAQRRGEHTRVLVLMPHPMETGLGTDASGQPVTAHYITDVRVMLGERLLLAGQLSIAVSRDPLLSFRFRGGEPGERVSVSWTDNLGMRQEGEGVIV